RKRNEVQPMDQERAKLKGMATWFRKWFLDNKVVAILLITLLLLANLLLFSKITYLLHPVKEFFSVIGLPVIMAGILFYLLNPLIDWLERKKVPRIGGIITVFLVIIGLVVWGIIILIPII